MFFDVYCFRGICWRASACVWERVLALVIIGDLVAVLIIQKIGDTSPNLLQKIQYFFLSFSCNRFADLLAGFFVTKFSHQAISVFVVSDHILFLSFLCLDFSCLFLFCFQLFNFFVISIFSLYHAGFWWNGDIGISI